MIIGLDTRNSKSTEHKVQMLEDYIQRLRKELEHTLQNLDEKNINQFAKIKTAQIEKLIVGGNVTMGPDAYISWDNVTGNKPTQYTDELALEAINSTYIDANGVWTPNVYATNISALKGKIKTAQIEDLIVGGNVAMGPDAVISWGQVTDADTYSLAAWKNSGYATHIDANGIYTGTVTANKILIGGEYGSISFDDLSDKPTPYTDSDALAAWVASNYATYITSTGVYTGTVAANKILIGGDNGSISFTDLSNKPFIPSTAADVGALPVGTHIPSTVEITQITKDYIETPNLITNIAQVNETLRLGSTIGTGRSIIFGSNASIANPVNTENLTISAFYRIDLDAQNGAYANNSKIATESYVSSGYSPLSHSHSEYASSSHSHSEYATTLWVTNTFARKDHIHSGYYLTIDSFNTKMAQHITDYHS